MAKAKKDVVTDEVKTDETVKADETVKTDETGKTKKDQSKKDQSKKDQSKKDQSKKDKVAKVLKFSKKQFVNSKRFAKRKDVVNALLDDDKQYSIAEVEQIINDFLYGKKK